jgi:hypothetical protein
MVHTPFRALFLRFILNVVVIVSGYELPGEHFHRSLHPEKVKWQFEMDGLCDP